MSREFASVISGVYAETLMDMRPDEQMLLVEGGRQSGAGKSEISRKRFLP